MGLSCLILLLALTMTFSEARKEWRDGWLLAFVGVLGAAQSYCFFMSIKFLPTSFASLVFFLYPLAGIVIERLVFGTRITPAMAMAIPLITVGATLTLFPGFQGETYNWAGMSWVLPVPVLYAIYLSLSARTRLPQHPISRALRLQTGMVIGFLPLIILEGLQGPVNASEWIWVLSCAVFGGALGISLFAYSVTRLGASVFGVVAAIELVTIVSLGIFVLRETVKTEQLVGMLIILFAIICSALQPRWLPTWRFWK